MPHDLSISKDTICSVKKKNASLHPYFKGSSFKWSSALFMLSLDGSGWFALSDVLLLYGQKEFSFFLNNGSWRCVLNLRSISLKKCRFEDFFRAEILLCSDRGALVYSLLNLIHFHMNTLTFPWEIEEIIILIIIWLVSYLFSAN